MSSTTMHPSASAPHGVHSGATPPRKPATG